MAAEAIGMTAASAAARAATDLPDAAALLVVVGGGLVEGAALGWLQAGALADLLGPRRRRRWFTATVLVAGVGWAAASAPATLAEPGEGTSPPMLVVLLAAAGLGAGMGSLLGAAQAWALRGAVRHPARWIGASVVGWSLAMPVIFLGATTAGAAWPAWAVVGLGTATGLVAGGVLGVSTAPFLARLDAAHGPPPRRPEGPEHSTEREQAR
jgi:MFS family permease